MTPPSPSPTEQHWLDCTDFEQQYLCERAGVDWTPDLGCPPEVVSLLQEWRWDADIP